MHTLPVYDFEVIRGFQRDISSVIGYLSLQGKCFTFCLPGLESGGQLWNCSVPGADALDPGKPLAGITSNASLVHQNNIKTMTGLWRPHFPIGSDINLATQQGSVFPYESSGLVFTCGLLFSVSSCWDSICRCKLLITFYESFTEHTICILIRNSMQSWWQIFCLSQTLKHTEAPTTRTNRECVGNTDETQHIYFIVYIYIYNNYNNNYFFMHLDKVS